MRPDTLNLDESQLPDLVNERTRAIVAMHYAGVGCAMDAISAHRVAVVEDNAHGLFGRYRGRPLGTFGALAAQSFHETKNLTCGEGGALVVNDERLVERAEVIREKGTDRKKFFRGQVDKYTWIDLGSSYVLTDLLAAFLAAQLEGRAEIQAARRSLWERYDEELAAWVEELGARRPIVPKAAEQPWHMYYLLLPSLDVRTALIPHLRERGILAVFHYLPLRVLRCPVRPDRRARRRSAQRGLRADARRRAAADRARPVVARRRLAPARRPRGRFSTGRTVLPKRSRASLTSQRCARTPSARG